MKKIFFCVLCLNVVITYAQKEAFDLITYTPPKAWKKQPAEGAVQFSKEDATKGTYCMITVFKAVAGTANSKENFDMAWTSLVKETVTVSTAPEMQPAATENGWEVQSGYAPFENDGNKGVVVLVTSSGFEKMMNIVILTNTDVYEKNITAFLESIDLKKPEISSPPIESNNPVNTAIAGTWGKAGSVNPAYNDAYATSIAGYTKDQYTFNSNGSYHFISKTFRMSYDKILLVKESGTYQVSENNITINPQTSVIEAWSKKDGVDKWGKLLSSQKRTIEKITYQFTKHYFSGIQQWNLVLQGGKTTQRDGPFSTNTTFTNAWYYSPITSNNPLIELPGGQQLATEELKQEDKIQQPAANGFAFTTTNFDDGWTSIVQEDWVQTTKGNIKVLIHYPNKKADDYNPDLLGGLKNAWNVLVAPKYSSATNMEFKPLHSWQSIEFAEADMVEKATGKKVHVALFKKNYSGGNGKFLEFITADKNAFEKVFGAYINDASADNWDKIAAMANYNKFAIAASDLKGKWTNNFTGMTQYVNAYTGASAGADTHASNQNFEFTAGNTYKWDLAVASGFIGNIKFQGVKSSGKFSVPNNWQVYFSDIEGKPKTYNAFFTCIKGARILWIDDIGYGKKE
ncbi:MAG: hypothetical protein E6H07_11850 [Bacteroidetes bacterium]|nr:MAG: hypothetical protein E6H07_11850 [Bacteroidota bacterium]